jgi:CubicO group peptidase (beta-lactamase class C family)
VEKMKKNILRLIIFISTFVIWCNFGLTADDKPDYWPTKGWKTAYPESQGMDSELLVKLLETIGEKHIAIYNVLVIRNGYVVLDAYSYPYNSDDTLNIHSCTKSVSSALVGIGIDKGYIKDVSQPVLDFFPMRIAKNLDADKKSMALENLLTMTTGLECRDSGLHDWRGLRQMKSSADWVQFVIDLPMAEVPGTHFEYCNGASFLLSAILQKQTSMNTLSFANKHLFVPLGISDVSWPSNPQGITAGHSDLRMRPHDMAKIGYLYLNDGLWDGKRIISSQWIKASTRSHIAATLTPGYGYQWWIVNPGVYTAVGHKGQFIIVVIEKNMVAVFTSDLSPEDSYSPLGLLTSYIIPAVKSDEPLPENPKGEKALKSLITLWQTTSLVDRWEMSNEARKFPQRLKFEEYVNNEYGFSAKYDAELLSMDWQLVPPRVFRRRGLSGFPIFTILVDDIPEGMELENTVNYMIDLLKITLPITNPKIRKQELIKLSDGTDANYFEINLRLQSRGMLSVGVFAYKNNKIIGAVTGSFEETPIEYLAGMVKSLRFKK